MEAAKTAASAAIDQILDGTWFAVIAGTHLAYLAYPVRSRSGAGMVRMDAQPRYEAAAGGRAVPVRRRHGDGHLADAGRTAVRLGPDAGPAARDPADRRREPQRDARAADQPRSPPSPASSSATAAASASTGRSPRCAGSPRPCSARSTSSPSPSQMAQVFADLMRTSMSRGVADAQLRVWAPQGAQVHVRPPGLAHGRGPDQAPGRGEPADRWLPDRVRGRTSPATTTSASACPPRRSARSSWRRGSSSRSPASVVAQGLVKAKWSDDDGLTTRINPEVAHYTGQTELAEAIQEGLAAKAAGDDADRDDQARPGRPAGRRRRATRRPPPGCARWSTSTTSETGTVRLKRSGRQGRRDGPGHRLDQDHPRTRRTEAHDLGLPRRPHLHRRRLLRRLRNADRRQAGHCRRLGARRPALRHRSAPSAAPAVTGQPCPNCATENVAEALVLRELRLRLHHRHHAAGRWRAPGAAPPRCGCRRRSGHRGRATPPPPAHRIAVGTPYRPRPAATSSWVAEVWIDPAWYEAQESPDPLPSPGLPAVDPAAQRVSC